MTQGDWESKALKFGKDALSHQAEYAAASSRAARLTQRAQQREARSTEIRRQAEVQAMGHKFIYDQVTGSRVEVRVSGEGGRRR